MVAKEFPKSLEKDKENVHDDMINIDDNSKDASLISPCGKKPCNSGHNLDKKLHSSDRIPLLELQHNSSSLLLNRLSDNNNNYTSQNIKLMADGRNNYFRIDELQSNETRIRFVKIVYCILSIMLIIEAIPTLIFNFSPQAHDTLKKHFWLIFIPSMLIYLVTTYRLSFYEYIRKYAPTNYMLVTIQFVSIGVLLSCAIMKLEWEFILLALLYRVGITVAITILATCCPIWVTKRGTLMAITASLILIFAFITAIVFFTLYCNMKLATLFLGSVVGFLCSVVLAFNTQNILGGEKYEIAPDEFIFAVIVMVTDMEDIFLTISMLINTWFVKM